MSELTNLEKFKKDLSKLVAEGGQLLNAIQRECMPEEFDESVKKSVTPEEFSHLIKNLPSFKEDYQSWYSEALPVIRQLLPDRLNDFKRLFEKNKRKDITYENYVIEDYLQGLKITRGNYMEKVVGPDAAIPKFTQQLNILKSATKRFESSLFDIIQVVQADLFDSELEAAKELNSKGFTRGAGAIAGVVLEGHLLQVCKNHDVIIQTKKPSIGDYNDLLKKDAVFDVTQWRFIQHLSDIRVKCDHKKEAEPKKEEVDELIAGVEKIIKTVF